MGKFEKRLVVFIAILLIVTFAVNTYAKKSVERDIEKSFHRELTKLDFHKIDFDSGLVYKVEYQDKDLIHEGYSYVDFSGVYYYESYSVPNYDKLVKMIDKIEISDLESNCSTDGQGAYDLSYSLLMTFPSDYDIRDVSMKYDIYYYIGFPYKSSEEVFGEKNAQFQFTENELVSTSEDGSYTMKMKANMYYKLNNKNLKERFINQKDKAVVYVKSKDYVIREIGK